MALTITGNSILDFAVVQAMSVYYLSEAALHLMKWQDTKNKNIEWFSESPVAAWYDKAVGPYLKTANHNSTPCMITTAYSIQTLSQLANFLPNYPTVSCLSHSTLHQEWKTIAALQLQFCLEYQEENSCTPSERAAILEGGSYLIYNGNPVEETLDFMPALQNLYDKITEELDISMVGTMELACVIRGISVWYRNNNIKQRSDFLTSLTLEVLNRKSRSGLFHCSPEGYASAPSGQQFFIIDALLQSYPFIQLDHVLEETFYLFTNLYQIAYKDAIELFGFKRRNISYTAFEVGALLTCLNSIAEYSTIQSGQKDIVINTIDSFLELLIESYHQYHEKEINKLMRWICLSYLEKTKRDNKPKIHTVFPKRIYLKYPYQDIDWSRKGIVDQKGIFYLCSSILTLLNSEDISLQNSTELKMDIPTMETLKTFLDSFI